MRKKVAYILLFITSMVFFGISNVCAETKNSIVCLYSVADFSDSIEFIIHYDNRVSAGGHDVMFSLTTDDDCPDKIYVDKDTKRVYNEKKSDSNIIYEVRDRTERMPAPYKVYCGNITGIPKKVPELSSYVISIIQIAVPIILVILGSIDLFKGITAQKEDEIKKGQQTLIKRLITAALIFFVVVIVKFFVSLIANSTSTVNIVDCIDCFINNDCNV